MIQLIAFYLFATLVIASGAMVIFARNPVIFGSSGKTL